MNIFDLAAQAGLQVLLDARIGNETYHSVSGSLASLQRFADAVAAAALAEVPRTPAPKTRAKPSISQGAATRGRRARRLARRCRCPLPPRPASARPIRSVARRRARLV